MKYCTICKDYFKEEHDDLWDCIVVYEKKNNQVGETMKNYISNLQKREKKLNMRVLSVSRVKTINGTKFKYCFLIY